MDPFTASALIGAGSSLIGGYMQQRAARRAQDISREQAAANMQLQREFAQHGIRWKVDDAKGAGIHPLYALGAQTHSFAPVGINVPTGGGLGRGLAAAGQDISRAMQAKTTARERQEYNMLQNELLKAQIANVNADTSVKLRGPQVPPPLPDALGVVDPLNPPEAGALIIPDEAASSRAKEPDISAAGVAGSQIVRLGEDSYAYRPGPDVQMDEITSPGSIGWYAQQQLNTRPMPFDILQKNHPGAIGWNYNPMTRTFKPHYEGDRWPLWTKIFYMNPTRRAKPRPHPRRRINIGGYGG